MVSVVAVWALIAWQSMSACELEKQAALLEKLGKHKIGKSCLYIKKFDEVHLPTLKKLVKEAYKSPAIAGATID